ncbi:MAG: MFS transporter, partial [Planctomycetes bacterium]|nr:MFS transporter [Planctomycetota bacterium]
ATLIGSAFCLPIGWLFDRYDRRWVLAINLLLLGCVVLGMSQVTDLQMLSVTIMLTRGLGQSALSVVSISIVAKSFPAQRLGLAMAWYAILSALFHLALINGVAWAFTFEGVTWRTVWFGIGIALVTLSAAAMLLPRITLPNEQREAPTGASALTGYTLKESLRTPAFWTFSLTISLWGMIYAGVSLFNEDIFRERGFDRGLYFRVLSEVTIVAIASKFFFGWMVNYVSLNRLLALCLFVTALSLAGLTRATEEWHAYAYGIGLGIASGAVALLFFAAWGKMYGMRELGQIQGAAQMLTVFASAAGPLVFSLAKRESNSYSTVFLSLAVAILFMAIASILTPLPHPWKHPQLDNQKDTH